MGDPPLALAALNLTFGFWHLALGKQLLANGKC
jgi:hypothetical protein